MDIKPKCKLIGTDGNVFAIIGRVSECLKKADMREDARRFVSEAFMCKSYVEVLALCHDYVEVM